MKTRINNLILVVIILLLAAYLSFDFKEKQNTRITSSTTQTSVSDTNISVDDQNKIMQAYQQQRSNIQVQAQGIVKAVLPDDNQGSKHQKMILKLENGLTVLIAHNIDLAPRIDELKKGGQLHCCPTNITRRTSIEVLLVFAIFYQAQRVTLKVSFQIN